MIDWRQYVRAHLPALRLAAEREAEIVEELAQQLEAAYDTARANGASVADATERAEAEIADWESFAATRDAHRAAAGFASARGDSPLDRRGGALARCQEGS